ncbi:MAG: mechanosensitive ion channel [Crocinitomicaceae bacterium]|nr:mechanosensitive ion channel [Crocinitomicaceae bacterium]MBK8925167.1 mechanosensitive ion channel [Crocinitomicaceae bacterium]
MFDFLTYALIQQGEFALTIFNLVVFVALYLCGKLFVRFIKRYFNEKKLTDKQVTIEGREIAIWKLTKQIIWIVIVLIGYQSLRLNNTSLDIQDILQFEFFRFDTFHIAVYHFFVIVIVVVFARLALSAIKVWLLRAANKKQGLDHGTQYVYVKISQYIVFSIASLIILRSLGMNLTLFLGATAFLLVGVGLGLQHIFSMYFSGLFLLLERSVKVGDIVEIPNLVNDNVVVAKIIEINLRTSKIETRDGMILIVPNNKLTHETVNNWTYGSHLTRFTIPVTVAYGSDLELVKEILIRCAQAHPHVTDQKEIKVRCLNFGDHGIELDVVFWAEQNFYIEIHKSDIRFAIEREFRKYQIVIPYKQLVIHQANSGGI